MDYLGYITDITKCADDLDGGPQPRLVEDVAARLEFIAQNLRNTLN